MVLTLEEYGYYGSLEFWGEAFYFIEMNYEACPEITQDRYLVFRLQFFFELQSTKE